jgi:hypothetical protein
MPDSHNRNGVTYSLTVFARVRAGHEEQLRAHIESLPLGPDSPLARLAMLHYSRLQIFSDLVYQGRPQRHRDRLEGSHLVFTSSIDGELDPYLEAICDRLGPDADAWWSHCEGYPGTADRAAFKRWIRAHQNNSALFAVAAPSARVKDVLESLTVRERLVEFAASAQGLDDAELHRRFVETFAERG